MPLAIHSDAPITPLGAAVHRLVRGQPADLDGPRPRRDASASRVADALHAITLGAACTLSLDHRIGSIEIGKCADFCVLDDDPLAVRPRR